MSLDTLFLIEDDKMTSGFIKLVSYKPIGDNVIRELETEPVQIVDDDQIIQPV